MRILQVGPIPPDVGGQTRGGVATHLWGLATHLAAQNHRVAVLADNCVVGHSRAEFRDGVEIYGRPRPLQTSKTNQLLGPAFWKAALRIKRHFGSVQSWSEVIFKSLGYCRVIALFKPDVIHVHHLERRFPLAYFGSSGNIPLVTTVHSSSFMDFAPNSQKEIRRKLIEKNLLLSRHLIFVSHFVRARYESLFPGGLEKQKKWIIPNPVDTSLYRPLPQNEAREYIHRDSNQRILLFVGRLVLRKGPHTLVEAVAKLREKGWMCHVLLIGDGPQKAEIDRLIKERGLCDIASLEGTKSNKELVYYYNGADVFVLPSQSEGFALAFLEAIACGCPVVGTRGVANELITSELIGYLVPWDDVSYLTEILEKALSQSWQRDKIRQYALANYSWENGVRRFEEVYRELVCAARLEAYTVHGPTIRKKTE